MTQKRDWLRRRADHIRRAVVLEPRGHAGMTAALLTEPASPGAHAGIVFMDAGGYPGMSAHGIIAAATIALERGLVFSRDIEPGAIAFVLDTPAGTVHARARADVRAGAWRVDTVTFTNVPAFVVAASLPVRLATRQIHVDVAYAGAFYAIADTEAVGIPLDVSRLPDLLRLGASIRESIDSAHAVQHPLDPSVSGIGGVIFTGAPADPEAHLRNVTVTPGGVDRSAGGTGTAAVMAVLDAMGLLPDDQPFVHEGPVGSLLRGRVVRRTIVGDLPAIVAEIEGSAWITGEHAFVVSEEDPLREGFVF